MDDVTIALSVSEAADLYAFAEVGRCLLQNRANGRGPALNFIERVRADPRVKAELEARAEHNRQDFARRWDSDFHHAI